MQIPPGASGSSVIYPLGTAVAGERHSVASSAPSMLENDPEDPKFRGESKPNPTKGLIFLLEGRSSLTRQRSYVTYQTDAPSYRRAPRAGAIITSARLSRRRYDLEFV